MSDAKPVPVHSKSIPESMELAKEIVSTDKASLKENICVDVEAPKVPVYDITLKKRMIDPSALLRQKTNQLINCFSDATPWAYALSSATLFMVPLTICVDMECMLHRLPTSVCNLWYTHAVVIITIIILNLLLAALLSVKSVMVNFCLILNHALLVFYYVLGFVLYIAIQPYNTHLALHVFGTTCAIAFPSWILCRSMRKKPKVRIVYITHA